MVGRSPGPRPTPTSASNSRVFAEPDQGSGADGGVRPSRLVSRITGTGDKLVRRVPDNIGPMLAAPLSDSAPSRGLTIRLAILVATLIRRLHPTTVGACAAPLSTCPSRTRKDIAMPNASTSLAHPLDFLIRATAENRAVRAGLREAMAAAGADPKAACAYGRPPRSRTVSRGQ